MFNVGEMIKMPDGQIKSKDKLRDSEEAKARRAKEEADFNEQVKKVKDAFNEARAKMEAQYAADGREMTTQQVQRLRQQYPIPARISNKQRARQEALAPRPTPPKPIIPEGFSIPEGEEDLLALWDITDEDIVKRINHRKKEKAMAARELRRIQKEKKKFNRAMKMLKKQCAHDGVLWDPVKAEREVLGQLAEESDSESQVDNGDSDADSDSGSKSDFSSDSDSDDEVEVVDREGKKLKKADIKLKGSRPKIDPELLAKANEFEAALKQKKKDKKDKRKQERKEKAAKEAAEAAAAEAAEKAKLEVEKKTSEKATSKIESSVDSTSKKRKRIEDPVEDEKALRKAEKKAKRADKKIKNDNEDKVAPISLPGEHNSSKRKRVEQNDEDREANVSKEKREKKKARKSSKVEPGDIPMDDIKSLISELVNPESVEDDEAKAKREKRERKAAKKAAKSEIKAEHEDTPTIKSEQVNEDEEAKAKREKQERKQAKRATKASRAKLPESADDKLDTQIAERQAKMKADAVKVSVDAPVADQWNPDALDGDDARKSKFMRLLGAGKGKTDGEMKPRAGKDAKKTVEEISRVQSELERQYESGMKMKHDGGAKRRGLGA